MRTGGQSDMTKLMIAFRNFAKAPKNRAGNNSSHMQFLCRMTSDSCFIILAFSASFSSSQFGRSEEFRRD
jgi:hypothetical protein